MANKDSGVRFIGKETGCYCHIVGNKCFGNRDLSMVWRTTMVLLNIGVLAGASILAGCGSFAKKGVLKEFANLNSSHRM